MKILLLHTALSEHRSPLTRVHCKQFRCGSLRTLGLSRFILSTFREVLKFELCFVFHLLVCSEGKK